MEADFQFEYTHYPRWHDNDLPQPGHQVVVYEVEQAPSGINVLAAVGNLSHRRLMKEATDQDVMEWPNIALPKQFSHKFLSICGWWRYTPDLEGRIGTVVANAIEPREDQEGLLSAEEFVRHVGFAALAAARYSMEVQAFRSGERYSGYVTPHMLQDVFNYVALGEADVVK